MTSGTHTHTITAPVWHTPLRLRLKPTGPATGYVDGAWWPRSRDLIAELPALAEAVSVRLGQVQRVAYALTTWDAAPRRAQIDGFRVRLEGFTYQDRDIIHVTGSNGGRISLLVVPPEMTGPAGQDALMTAGRPDNADRPADILIARAVPTPRPAMEDAAQRWESDGGQLRHHE